MKKLRQQPKEDCDAYFVYGIVWYIYVYTVEYMCYTCKEKCYTRWQEANYNDCFKNFQSL